MLGPQVGVRQGGRIGQRGDRGRSSPHPGVGLSRARTQQEGNSETGHPRPGQGRTEGRSPRTRPEGTSGRCPKTRPETDHEQITRTQSRTLNRSTRARLETENRGRLLRTRPELGDPGKVSPGRA